jgi:hypothetical protein
LGNTKHRERAAWQCKGVQRFPRRILNRNNIRKPNGEFVSELLERLADVLRALENAPPGEQGAAEGMMEPFMKKIECPRIPLGSQQRILLTAEAERDRATVAEFGLYSEHPSIRALAADVLAELSKPRAPRWPSIQI